MVYADDAEAVVDFCVADGNVGKITTLTACNAVYILAKIIGKQQAEEKIKELIDLIGLVGVEPESVSGNIAANRIDFEDSVSLHPPTSSPSTREEAVIKIKAREEKLYEAQLQRTADAATGGNGLISPLGSFQGKKQTAALVWARQFVLCS